MSSAIRTVFGTWAPAPANRPVDLEAGQVVVGRYEPGPSALPAPTPALAHSPRTTPGADAVDDFFGASNSPRGTRDSRHDNRAPAAASFFEDDVPPPPYTDFTELPSYASVAEPPTLAMYLFKFGFLFPLFWLAGIFVLICPLSPPENWEPSKTEAERQELLGLLRRTEMKWAKRCLLAFSILALVIVTIVVTAVLVMRST